MKLKAKNPYILAEAKLGGLWGTQMRCWVVNPVTSAKDPRQMRMFVGARGLADRRCGGIYFSRTEQSQLLFRRLAEIVSANRWNGCLALRIRYETTVRTTDFREETKSLDVEALDDPEAVESWRDLRTVRPAIGLETRPIEIVHTRMVQEATTTVKTSAFFDELQWELVRKAVEGLAALYDPRRPDR